MNVRLLDIAHARSGDKGDTANVGVIALKPEWYPVLVQHLTLSPPHLSLHSQKGRLQRSKLADLLAADLLGAGGHRPHEVGALCAKVLNQSGEVRH